MTQSDIILDEPADATRRRPLAYRLTFWLVISLCAAMMVTVLLSDPRVTARFQGVSDWFGARIEQVWPSDPDDAASADASSGWWFYNGTGKKSAPSVSVMPENRLPVRRAGAGN